MRSKKVLTTLKMKAPRPFESSAATWPAKQHYISKELNKNKWISEKRLILNTSALEVQASAKELVTLGTQVIRVLYFFHKRFWVRSQH
jgi:hypothetical protein